MLKPDDTETNESMSLAELVDLNGMQELPQLSAVIERRISAEADEGASTSPDQVSLLEETVCELVDLVAELEKEVEERRRRKRT